MINTQRKTLAILIARHTRSLPAALASTLMLGGLAHAAENQENTMVVSATAAESVTAPLQGMVAKSSDAGTKTAVPLVKTPQAISVVTRDQMDALGVSSIADALNYTSGVFTNYRGSSNRNDEVVARGFR